METGGNSYVMSFRRRVRTFPFITRRGTSDSLVQGQGVEAVPLFPALRPASGRAGLGACIFIAGGASRVFALHRQEP